MDADLGKVVKKKLEAWYNQVSSQDNQNCDYDRFVFTNCRNVKPGKIRIKINQRSPDWQVGFFDADCEVYFNEIVLEYDANFSSIVRNYWWNGKEGDEKKEGYYSLVKSTKKLEIYKEHISDLLDYMEGRYKASGHWQIHKLDKNVELKISGELEETIIERLQKYFDNIWRYQIIASLKTENSIVCNCEYYLFKNCKEVVPQKLVINATVEQICFQDTDNEVHIPEIVMEEKADLESIIQNEYGYSSYYSLLPYVQTLVVRNNSKVLCDLADYINEKYEISSCWHFYGLINNINVVIESPGDAFPHVLRISDCFQSVTVNRKQASDYIQIIEQEELKKSGYKAFKTCFEKHNLRVYPHQYGVEFQKELELIDYVYNIRKSVDNIDLLIVEQKLDIDQFVCFHDINKPVTVDTIVIDLFSDLRSVLQNAYYSNSRGGFFSLLKAAKKLEIHYNEQAVEDLADYVDGGYVLHPKWEGQALNKDLVITMQRGDTLSLDVAKMLRNYFKNVYIDSICAPLETENFIDQECEDQYVFDNCRDANPQKLVVNAKLEGNGILIFFNNADGEVYIPEITIGEHGSFDAIVCNKWHNCKNGDEYKNGYYSLVSHAETLTIQNNPQAVCDLDRYVFGNYKLQQYLQNYLKVHKLSKNTIIRINGVKDLDEQINRLKDYFGYIVIDDRKALGNQRRQAIANIKRGSDKIQQQSTANTNKRNTITRADAEIAETRRRIERSRARLRRRCVRFQEYLALTE